MKDDKIAAADAVLEATRRAGEILEGQMEKVVETLLPELGVKEATKSGLRAIVRYGTKKDIWFGFDMRRETGHLASPERRAGLVSVLLANMPAGAPKDVEVDLLGWDNGTGTYYQVGFTVMTSPKRPKK